MNEDIAGKYVHKRVRSHYIELKPDGNYFLFEGGASGVSGAYEVDGMDITIFGVDSTSKGKIRNGIITDSEGDKWMRADATDDPLPSMTWLPAILRRDDFPWELIDVAMIVVIVLLFMFAR